MIEQAASSLINLGDREEAHMVKEKVKIVVGQAVMEEMSIISLPGKVLCTIQKMMTMALKMKMIPARKSLKKKMKRNH